MLNAEAVKAAASIERIVGQYIELKKDGARYTALCPFHSERTPSFVVTPAMGIYKCFGCDASGDVFAFIEKIEGKSFTDSVRTVAEIVGVPVEESKPAKAGLVRVKPAPPSETRTAARQEEAKPKSAESRDAVQPKHVATYEYMDATGQLLYEVLRFEPGKNGKAKDFRQRRRAPGGSWAWGISAGSYRKGGNSDWYPVKDKQDGDIDLPDVERVLWRLPAVLDSWEVAIVEGERDVITLEANGFVATTVSGGSKQPWAEGYTESLRGKRVIIMPDNDVPGEAHGRKIERALRGIAAELIYVQMPKGFKDVTEYVEAGRTADDIRTLIAQVEEFSIEEDRRHRGLLSVVEVLSRYKGGYEAFVDPSKRPKGLLTGYHKFDEMTLGLHPGELFVLAARPAMGKTSLALNIAQNVARRRKAGVGVFSLEMTSESLMERMACSAASIDSMKFRSGYCNGEELRRMHNTIGELASLPIFFDDYTPLTIEELRRKILLFSQTQELSFVAVDYLQLMTGSKKSSAGNRVGEVSEQSRGLKLLAREFKIPIMVLSQLSRACEIRPGDHRPILADLRESGSIEQDADMVAFVYREEQYRPDKPDLHGRAELIIAKQRNGPTGKVKLEFKHGFTRFDNPASEWDDPYEGAA